MLKVGDSSGSFVWIASESQRNQFACFRREFRLESLPEQAAIHLFADTRYRLSVNGQFVYAGPARFVTQHPEFDAIDLSPWLQVGPNTLEVEVNYFGASSFQTMPDGRPGFVACGSAGPHDLGTPGDWKGFRATAWRSDAPVYSFAQGPVEICDTRRLTESVAEPLRTLSTEDAPWGPLQNHSGTPLPFHMVRPSRIELAGELAVQKRIIGFMSHDADANRSEAIEVHVKPFVGFAMWIHADLAGTQTLDLYWSELWINGEPVRPNYTSDLGNHGTVNLPLKAGWNLLTGRVEVLTEYWAYLIGIPPGTGLSVHASPDRQEARPLAVGPIGPKESVVVPTLDQPELPKGWRMIDGDNQQLTPARLMGWDAPSESCLRGLAIEDWSRVRTINSQNATWCVGFEGEFLGHIVLDVDAPTGTVLDVGSDDWQSHHRGLALFKSNPFTDSADRFVLSGGRQRIGCFHPRGGKLIQITMRAPESSPLSLHDVCVRSRQIWSLEPPPFESDCDVLNWAWEASFRTLAASTDDSYSDCPWRERGSYIGDCLVNVHLTELMSADRRVARRTLTVFGQAALDSGQLAGCAPAWLRKPHEDFTLLWILAVRNYWAMSGEPDFLETNWPVIERIWASPTWRTHTSGLWSLEDSRAFLDWGVHHSEREGAANAAINMLRVAADRASAEIAEALGLTAKAAAFREDALQTEHRLRDVLWNDAEGRYFPGIGQETPGIHANILALSFAVGKEEDRHRILQFFEKDLRDNLAIGLEKGPGKGYLELYFLSYLLPALAEMGRSDLAEHVIQDHYGYLMALGDDTLPECFARVEHQEGSRCHSWAGAAAIYAAHYVLGIRQISPGDPNRFHFDPRTHGIRRASGTLAHPRGPIRVDWSMVDSERVAKIEAPEGVTVELG